MVADEDLAEWHSRLAEHFAALRKSSGPASVRPLFALEHGLDASERDALVRAVRIQIARSYPLTEHALAWVVYATEVGYRYSGDEYWQTFEEETPGWTVRGNRYWIRDQFRWFQNQYGGAEPAGRWAEWFTLICWPIAHAILPRDLQRQLARVLYELRHSFSAELFESPARLGELIAARSWTGTSRFQNFIQDTRLAGQIAAALLLQGQVGTVSLVHPAALHRIGEDLERERQAREWLGGARRFASERAKIRGLALPRGATSTPFRRPEEARAEVTALGIEPRFVLRPMAPDGSRWQVWLEIPDLSQLLLRFPALRDILTGSRCVVAGAAGRPLARGRCLHGAQRVMLARWPREDEVLLQFEQTDAQLEYLLRTECLLRPGPVWLFRVTSDGMAYESRGLRVRPGQRYIVVTSSEQAVRGPQARPVELECAGVLATFLDLPTALTKDWEVALHYLGLGQAKTIEIWPAGLGAVVWDGEGSGEWLASERPCLAIRSDYPIAALLVSMTLDGDSSIELSPIKPGEPIFVELPRLPVGLHRVHVSALTAAGVVDRVGDLEVVMRIREARPWTPGVSPHGPLLVQVDPASPTLEQLWDGHADIEVRGPTGRSAKCTVMLFHREDAAPTVVEKLPPLSLPITPEYWRSHFEKHFREIKKAQNGYDTARLARLEFTAEELGAFTIQCEREFVPLRWVLRERGGHLVARLVDDSGEATLPTVAHFTFYRPTVTLQLAPASEYDIAAPGGLYLARQQGFAAAIIALPPLRSLADLGGTVQIDACPRSAESVLDAIESGRVWGSARSSGDILSWSKRRKVMHAITRHILRIVGGERWATAELEVEDTPDGDLLALKRAVSNRPDQIGIAAAIALNVSDLAKAALEARVSRLAELATVFGLVDLTVPRPASVESPLWISEFALRLASNPQDVAAWAGSHLRSAIAELLDVPVFARAARFLVIATDRYLQSRTAPGEIYAGWEWVRDTT